MATVKELDFKKAWAWRKVGYAVAFLAVAVGGWFGFIDEIQADQILNSLDRVVAWVGGMTGLGVAVAKTHPGSDSTVTVDDVKAAAAEASARATASAAALGDAIDVPALAEAVARNLGMSGVTPSRPVLEDEPPAAPVGGVYPGGA